jgi:urease accessory protein
MTMTMTMTMTTGTGTGTGTATTTTMDTATRTDAGLLRLVWLASPALPVGGFSYSEGLEAAVEAGLVTDEASAGDWLVDQLHLALAGCDLAVVAQAVVACRAQDEARVAALDAWVRRTRETAELRLQAEQMGRSLGDWGRSLAPDAPPAAPLTYPVAFARAAAPVAAPVRDILLAFAFGWAENMMQAAIKAVPLGQSAGQRILLRLADAIPAAADHALALDDADRQAFAPMLAILSARHETQYSRLFRS